MRIGGAGLVLALIAVMLRAALPTGWMVAAEHGPQLVICSGHAATPDSPAGKSDHVPQKPDQLCVFAGAHVALDAGQPLLPARFDRIPAAAVVHPLPTLSPGRGLAAPPPPSTGPPSFL
jgi:hypothetical protein